MARTAMWFKKASPRRQAIREDVAVSINESQAAKIAGGKDKVGHFILVAVVFFVVACFAQFWPGNPLPYHVGELAPVDLVAPVEFAWVSPEEAQQQRDMARQMSSPVLSPDEEEITNIQNKLNALKVDVKDAPNMLKLPASVSVRFPGLTDAALKWLQDTPREQYESIVQNFLKRELPWMPLVTAADMKALRDKRRDVRVISGQTLESGANAATPSLKSNVFAVYNETGKMGVEAADTKERQAQARQVVQAYVGEEFPTLIAPAITNFIMNLHEPTYRYNVKLSDAWAEQNAAMEVPSGRTIAKGQTIVEQGKRITQEQYLQLREARSALQRELDKDHPWAKWLSRLGRALIVLILSAAGAMYVWRLNHSAINTHRAWAVCALLLGTLLIAKVSVAAFPQSTYCMGIAPTLLTAIILVIAYSPRFALGISAIHGLLVTVSLGQNFDFFLALLAGVTVFSFGLSEIRTRGKLIEIGAGASAVIFSTVWALGLARMGGFVWMPGALSGAGVIIDMPWLETQSLYAAAAGIGVAMFALAVLPSVERIFRITTAMTLLELGDANKPLLRRLSQEAAGTFNHSLTVGIMAEAAGNAIGADGLLCRVGAYYHDVGKLSKPQYFIENQAAGHPNRHDKLSPAMSLLIIVGHVKDGIELAREYGLPSVVHQFIAQHHGTTLVEYFFHAARKKAEREEGAGNMAVSETEFRYPGPKPQTREAAIVMICDGCESAVRAIDEPTPGRIEAAVHNMIMKRLMDGQFSECDLTLRELSVIEETLTRTLAGIHHGRVPYPTSARDDIGAIGDVGLSQPA